MTKNVVISEVNANRLFWLGRYEERVYIMLHLLRKCYDKMIDGCPADYEAFWKKLDAQNTYSSKEDFELGMLFDDKNQSSIISTQMRAMDNAMLLRNNITSETLSFLEMSMALLRQFKSEGRTNITDFQQITDWSLAFFGSVEQRIENAEMTSIIYAGRTVEYIDMLLRFNYSFERVKHAFEGLEKYLTMLPLLVNKNDKKDLSELMKRDSIEAEEWQTTLKLINSLIRV